MAIRGCEIGGRARILIMGAAGRDFHNFNVFFRENKHYNVVGFTAAQIPNITNRRYPKELSGKLYPKGIPIFPEEKLASIVKKEKIDQVILAYSDISHDEVMHKASVALGSGADFRLMGLRSTMVKSKKPVISVCAVRTGAGKSQTTRYVAGVLKDMGLRVAIVRHPMPYGDLAKQVAQKFATLNDLDVHDTTIEEREEYEPHIENGYTVFAGVDYEKILKLAEKEADVIIWDGGNNDLPFYEPDLHIVVADPLRAGHETSYYPGEANLHMADIVVINKINTATKDEIKKVRDNVKKHALKAKIIEAMSVISVDEPELIEGNKVVVVEDGPTLTHGGMSFGAGSIAATSFGAKKVVDPRPYAKGSIKRTLTKYKNLTNLVPAMGYGKTQIRELASTLNAVPADTVVLGTPVDLRNVMKLNKPTARVSYELKAVTKPGLSSAIKAFARKKVKK